MTSVFDQTTRSQVSTVSDSAWLVLFAVGQPRERPTTDFTTRIGPALHLFHQESGPVTGQYASCAALLDGVLYNRDDLRQQFVLPGTANEAEILIHAYLRHGIDFARHVKGLFAFVLWDDNTQTLLAGRDPIGIYPLFYAEAGDELLFSTSIKMLHRHPRLSGRVNRALLADHLRHHWASREETFFEDIRRVPPGQVLRIHKKSHSLIRYWDPAPLDSPVKWITEDELEQFDVLLDKAVERYLELGPAAIYLSGGLDSVTIAAATAEISRQKGLPTPLALSLIFPDPECNEENVQKNVADGLGLPKYLIPFFDALGSRGLLRSALDLSRRLSVPLLNTWLPAYTHLAAEGVRQGRRVILTGNGGDEWLTVTPYYAADLVSRFDIRGLYSVWRNTQRSYQASQANIFRGIFWTFGLRPVLRDTARRAAHRLVPGLMAARRRRLQHNTFFKTPAWFAPDPALRSELLRRIEAEQPQPEPNSFYLREMRPGLDHPLITWDMEEVYEIGEQIGVKVLHPFWDAELVDLLYRTPPPLLNKNGRSKGLVRESLARRFPDLGFQQQKKVTSTNFFRTLMIEEGQDTWRSLGGAQALADLGIVESRTLDAAIESIVSSRNMPEAYRIWDVLNLEAWLRANA
jgi:asparagine synthase (glutamine-hydrolysing)